MIEERRIRIGILHPNWLPVAITFNIFSYLNKKDFKWKEGSGNDRRIRNLFEDDRSCVHLRITSSTNTHEHGPGSSGES